MEERIIGTYEGDTHGPLFVVFGGMHGNEPAGIKALEMVFKMLEVEPITNPSFEFKGRLLGLIGNLKAYNKNKRFIDKDLNRCWKSTIINQTPNDLAEHDELLGILQIIHQHNDAYKPTELIVLDLHTTSSFGGIFSIVSDDPKSTMFAKSLHAPVIRGFMNILEGTTLHYFNTAQLGLPTTALTFESGQHNETLSTNRAIAAIVNCLKAIGMVDAAHIENQHDKILISYAKDLPAVVDLVSSYAIAEDENFTMRPGFKNFQAIQKGQILADNQDGPITAGMDALILMPLYQDQGDDGFFLVH